MLSGPDKTAYILDRSKEWRPDATLVETGTADHINIGALGHYFNRLYTIELDYGFYTQAWCAFMDRPHITCLQGDSSDVLEHLCYRLGGPAVFWLDAHYCGGERGKDGDTPIRRELDIIRQYRHNSQNLILIDDARLFGSDPAYPQLGWIEGWAVDHGYWFTVDSDIITLERT